MTSFLGGIDLGDAAQRAMTADLELRRKDERNADRFYRYAYQGGADLCLRHGECWQGQVRPERFQHLAGEVGHCYATALRGCQADERLVYVEGYCTTGARYAISHGWCVDTETNTVVDLVLPCDPEGIERGWVQAGVGMKFLPPAKWAYCGVRFSTELVAAHYEALGLPMLDRSTREALESPGPNYAEPHDFPILKVPYEPQRTEMPPWHKPKSTPTTSLDEDESQWEDEEEDPWEDEEEDL